MSEHEWYIDGYGVLHGPKLSGLPGEHILPEGYTQRVIIPRSQIFHSQSGTKTAKWWQLRNWLLSPGVDIEPHFIVDMDGTVSQQVPVNRVAHCNYKANAFGEFQPSEWGWIQYGAISYETQDLGHATLDKTPWTNEQLDSLINVAAAVGRKYAIPYEACATWDDAGMDYHSKFQQWSAYKGKTCPGYARIKQMDWLRQATADKAASVCAC